MSVLERKQAIQSALNAFGSQPLYQAGMGLLDALGYRSEMVLRVSGLEEFRDVLDQQGRLRDEAAKTSEWAGVEFLRQITGADISSSAQCTIPFQQQFSPTETQSYVFVAVQLKRGSYTRTALSQITRAVNRVFDMPAMLLFKHGAGLTLAIINRRLSKRDETRDVLEKVTLVKDVSYADPLRAHIEILYDLSLDALYEEFSFHNFAGLHQAWQKCLASDALTKRFYRELANWYFWALKAPGIVLPRSIEAINDVKERENQRSIFFIRLLTRMIFCWFLQEKGLLPRDLFRRRVVEELLKDPSPAAGSYYRTFLQNLFFATLNQEQDRRDWRKKYQGTRNGNRGITTLWRYHDLLTSPDRLEVLLRDRIPFVNGGLFDCLDDPIKTPNVRLDDFSEEKQNRLCLPNELFFGDEREVDLSTEYDDARRKKEKVSGLIHIFSRYKFTAEENTPLEEEIALDPELLGKVFENLLAAYNPETGATARKQTGSFYTPREIVNYMVDESLLASLKTKLAAACPNAGDIEGRLRHLFSYNDQPHQFSPAEVNAFIDTIDHLKVLDPACGSGAFPMGILHKLVFVLGKLDPSNQHWKARQLATAREIPDPTVRERILADIEQAFVANELDYGRKLYLIEKCIYGVDIQPIAVQIAKLRFFISLVVDQKLNLQATNLGILSLPNLETRFVAANTLIGLDRPVEQPIRDLVIEAKEDELRHVRERHFLARTPSTKVRYREQDANLRAEIAELLESGGWDAATARKLASWDPYDQNASADFFDPEWMCGESVGFDITIGNPPYVRADEQSEWNRYQRREILASKQYETLGEKWDLYVPFIERSYKLLRPSGISTLIVSDAFCHSKYAQKSQNWFLRHARILRLDFCTNLQIFDAAVHNLIYFFQKADGTHHIPQRRVHHETFGNVSLLPGDEQAKLTYRAFFPEDRIVAAFNCASIALGDVCYVSKGMVVHADERKARGAFELRDLVSDHKDHEHSRKFVEGKHLARWLPAQKKWLEWGTSRAPTLYSRPTFLELYTVPEKIFIHRTAGEGLRSCYDSEQTLCNHTVMVCVPWHALHRVRNNSLKKAAR